MAITERQQIIGDQQPMSSSVTNPPTHGGGNPELQITGDQVPLTRNAVSPPTHTRTMGETQIIGDQCDHARNQSPVWAQANIPRSTLSNEPAGNDKS